MKRFIQILSIGMALIMLMTTEAIAKKFYTASPIDFFTKVASRTLSKELNLDLNRIQIYPTNQYTPAVQRLLQVAANVYDATTTNFFPTVFRPIFANDGTNIFITGYEQVVSVTNSTDSQLGLPVDIASLPVGISTNFNVYGIPWIIGVKKGFPNFNEFSMEEIVGVERRLQVTRPMINPPNGVDFATFRTNQLISMVITNWLGVECWNSYSNNYVPVSGNLNIVAQDNLSMTLTNDDGMIPVTQTVSFANSLNITSDGNPSYWPGTAPWIGGSPNPDSFDIPLITNFAMLQNPAYPASPDWWAYSFDYSAFFPAPTPPLFETNINNNFTFPNFGLLTTNRLQVFMLDGTHVIDYVQFCGPNNGIDLTANLLTDDLSGVWNTNLSTLGVPIGVFNQIQISRGNTPGGFPPAEDGAWNSDAGNSLIQAEEQAFFNAFFLPGNVGFAQGVTEMNLELSVVAPYSPIRYVVLYTTWQANDPLVHCLASDLNYTGESGTPAPGISVFNYGTTIAILPNLGVLNDHYSPWGGNPANPPNPYIPDDPNTVDAYNLAVKDPLIYSSDDWNFPTGQSSNLDWIGQVHRGTPWQTIDLKSALPDIGTWVNWTGDSDVNDASNSSPGEDWQLASLLVSMLNTNKHARHFPVNNPNPNDWQRLLNGLSALTNSSPDDQLSSGAVPEFGTLVISSNSSQASFIANAIESERAVQPGQFFSDVGDILATPQLSTESPFLNWNDTTQQAYGISDEAYEAIPAQLLPLLRADSVGSAGWTHGQMFMHFTGYDDQAYAIEVSSDLINWANISTNCPVDGVFGITNSVMPNAHQQFYRSILLQ
jgi:hypothetical protein